MGPIAGVLRGRSGGGDADVGGHGGAGGWSRMRTVREEEDQMACA